MKIDRITYLMQYMEYLKKYSMHSVADYEKIEDLMIKLFSCEKNKPSRKKPKLDECHCYSELPIYLVNGWHRRTNQSLTIRFAGQYIVNVTLPLRGSGIIFIEILKTPIEELNPPLILKMASVSTSSLSGFLSSIMR